MCDRKEFTIHLSVVCHLYITALDRKKRKIHKLGKQQKVHPLMGDLLRLSRGVNFLRLCVYAYILVGGRWLLITEYVFGLLDCVSYRWFFIPISLFDHRENSEWCNICLFWKIRIHIYIYVAHHYPHKTGLLSKKQFASNIILHSEFVTRDVDERWARELSLFRLLGLYFRQRFAFVENLVRDIVEERRSTKEEEEEENRHKREKAIGRPIRSSIQSTVSRPSSKTEA